MSVGETTLSHPAGLLPPRLLPLVWGAAVLAWGGRRFYPPGLWQGSGERRRIALTFDDGPHAERTPPLLDLLREEKIPAAFFMIGERAASLPDLVRQAWEEGHEIGNHTWSHSVFRFGSRRDLPGEVGRTEAVLGQLCPGSARLFRPPAGFLVPGDGLALAGAGVTPVYWSLVTGDWEPLPPGEFRRRFRSLVHPGAVAALHNGGEREPWSQEELRGTLRELRDEGYEFVSLSSMLADAGIPVGFRAVEGVGV